MRRRASLVMVLVACAAAAAGCARAASPDVAPGGVAMDTVVGRVYASREAPEARVLEVQLRDGSRLLLSGLRSVELRPLVYVGAIAEVWVAGRRDSSALEVAEFEVRTIGGQPVDDGHILVVGNRVLLETRAGTRIEITDPPPSLRYLPLSRVWVHRAPRGDPPFGIIVKR